MIKWFEGCSDEVQMIIAIPLIMGLSVFSVGIAGIILYYIVKFFEL